MCVVVKVYRIPYKIDQLPDAHQERERSDPTTQFCHIRKHHYTHSNNKQKLCVWPRKANQCPRCRRRLFQHCVVIFAHHKRVWLCEVPAPAPYWYEALPRNNNLRWNIEKPRGHPVTQNMHTACQLPCIQETNNTNEN